MPKFMTYQRPAPNARQVWQGGKPGAPAGRAGRKTPKPAPDAGSLEPRLDLRLPKPLPPRS